MDIDVWDTGTSAKTWKRQCRGQEHMWPLLAINASCHWGYIQGNLPSSKSPETDLRPVYVVLAQANLELTPDRNTEGLNSFLDNPESRSSGELGKGFVCGGLIHFTSAEIERFFPGKCTCPSPNGTSPLCHLPSQAPSQHPKSSNEPS